MEEHTYSGIVEELYNLSAQGVATDDVRFVNMLSRLSLAREKHSSQESGASGTVTTPRNPVNKARLERLMDQIDVLANYLSVGLDPPKGVLSRCGVDVGELEEECHEPKTSHRNEILYYAEVLHRASDYWRSNLGWVEYNEVLSENTVNCQISAINEMMHVLQIAISRGTPDGLHNVEMHIQKFGMENFANKSRVCGMLRIENFMSSLMRLERQLSLLALQRNLKRTLRFAKHLYLWKQPQAADWNAHVAPRDITHKTGDFINIHQEREKIRLRLAQLVYKSMENRMKLAEKADSMDVCNGFNPQWEEEKLSMTFIKDSKVKTMKELCNICHNHIRAHLNIAVIDPPMSDGDEDNFLERYRKVTYALKSQFTREYIQPARSLCATNVLKEHHMDGLSWLLYLYNNNVNGVLADDYKLNRVLHVVAFLAYIKDMKAIPGPHLIVVPLASVKSIWLSGFEEWFPTCNICDYEGSKAWRRGAREGWNDHSNSKLNFDVLFTTDHVLAQDKEILKRIKWEYIIVDGLQLVNHPYGNILRYLNNGFYCRRRLLLATEPLQIEINEVWPVANFIYPEMFNTGDSFHNWFAKPYKKIFSQEDLEFLYPTEDELSLLSEFLHNAIAPFVLSRSEGAYTDLSPCHQEHVVYCPMSGIQIQLLELFRKFYHGDDLNQMLKRICDHPYMLCAKSYPCDESVITISGKFSMLDLCITRLASAHRRIAVITPCLELIHLVEVMMHLRAVPYMRIDEYDSPEERWKKIDVFNRWFDNIPVMVVPKNACDNMMLDYTDSVICFEKEINSNFITTRNVLKEKDVLILRLAIPNVTDDPYLVENEVVLPQDMLRGRSSYSASKRRDEFMSKSAHSLYYLDKIMLRSLEDERLFFLNNFYRYMSQVQPVMDDLIIPPCIFSALMKSRKFIESELNQMKSTDSQWHHALDACDVWTASPNEETINRCKIYMNPDVPISSYNVMTGLSPLYPINRMNCLSGIMDGIYKKPIAEQAGQRAFVINNLIREALEACLRRDDYGIFSSHFMNQLYGGYLNTMMYPITLDDLHKIAADCGFPSLGSLSFCLERLSRNVRECYGERSDYYFRSLDMQYYIKDLIMQDLPSSLIWIYDAKAADEFQLLCDDIKGLYV